MQSLERANADANAGVGVGAVVQAQDRPTTYQSATTAVLDNELMGFLMSHKDTVVGKVRVLCSAFIWLQEKEFTGGLTATVSTADGRPVGFSDRYGRMLQFPDDSSLSNPSSVLGSERGSELGSKLSGAVRVTGPPLRAQQTIASHDAYNDTSWPTARSAVSVGELGGDDNQETSSTQDMVALTASNMNVHSLARAEVEVAESPLTALATDMDGEGDGAFRAMAVRSKYLTQSVSVCVCVCV